jgi:hypothetical protein
MVKKDDALPYAVGIIEVALARSYLTDFGLHPEAVCEEAWTLIKKHLAYEWVHEQKEPCD